MPAEVSLDVFFASLVDAQVLHQQDTDASDAMYVIIFERLFGKAGAAGPSVRAPRQRLEDHRKMGWMIVLAFWGRRDVNHRSTKGHWPAEVRWQRLLTSTTEQAVRARSNVFGGHGEVIGHLNEIRWPDSGLGYSARETFAIHGWERAAALAILCIHTMIDQAKNDAAAEAADSSAAAAPLLRLVLTSLARVRSY